MHEAREHLELQYTKQQQWFVEGIQEKQGQGKLSLAPNLLLNLVSCPVDA
jgi:hypothetical protein